MQNCSNSAITVTHQNLNVDKYGGQERLRKSKYEVQNLCEIMTYFKREYPINLGQPQQTTEKLLTTAIIFIITLEGNLRHGQLRFDSTN